MSDTTIKIAFQGVLGAYSHQACFEAYPEANVLPCNSFQAAIDAVSVGNADLAMLPVENSTYGRVADIHQLLPNSGLHIIGEHYVRVHINLLGLQGSKLSDIKSAMSHTVLLGQCRNYLKEHNIESITGVDTAGSAEIVSKNQNLNQAALASELAGKIYGLDVLARHIEDESNNTTRFLVMSTNTKSVKIKENRIKTSLVFRVRNIPAALYKAMGGFATNGVNMVKLESYMVDGSFTATQFYLDIIGHPDEPAVKRAMEELSYFTTDVKILGVYESGEY
ncbi:prephenate dehydratase [Amylibacter sp.]|jgi:prephenate dehydratase|nr:prephenate dehydratase [Rhodobacterales bacterium]MDA7738411.1 prephenate dehydratase [Amylibacter sp.]MBT4133509.1 prephenate dehydratase [Rhodobacterales bacterium]MBT4322519.1 prephenate dehydratase [Rhodobacterales bacterium]MBT6832824.1 prephenate dehydratase [Rhodobacterales bacterium]